MVYDEEDSGNFNYSDNQENLTETDENESNSASRPLTEKTTKKVHKK